MQDQFPFAEEWHGVCAEVVLFTAGLEDYAKPILDELDRRYNGVFEYRLYRPATVACSAYPCLKVSRTHLPGIDLSLGRTPAKEISLLKSLICHGTSGCLRPLLAGGLAAAGGCKQPEIAWQSKGLGRHFACLSWPASSVSYWSLLVHRFRSNQDIFCALKSVRGPEYRLENGLPVGVIGVHRQAFPPCSEDG